MFMETRAYQHYNLTIQFPQNKSTMENLRLEDLDPEDTFGDVKEQIVQEAYEGSVGIERIKLMLGNKTVANDQTLNTRKNDGKGEYILHKQDVKIRCYVIPEDELKF